MMNHPRWRSNNSSRHNPFLRLVRRHTNLATIMRVIAPGGHTTAPNSGEAQRVSHHNGSVEQPARAFIVIPGISLPEGTISEFMPLVRDVMVDRTVKPAHTAQRLPAVPLKIPPQSFGPTPGPTAPGIPANTPTPEKDKSTDDATWNRLHTIYRLHMEKEIAEETSTETPSPTQVNLDASSDLSMAGTGGSVASPSGIVQSKIASLEEKPGMPGIEPPATAQETSAIQTSEVTTGEPQKQINKVEGNIQAKREDRPPVEPEATGLPIYEERFQEEIVPAPTPKIPDEKAQDIEKTMHHSMLHETIQASESTCAIDHDQIGLSGAEPPIMTTQVQALRSDPTEAPVSRDQARQEPYPDAEHDNLIAPHEHHVQSEPLQVVWPVQRRSDITPAEPPSSTEISLPRFRR